MTWQGREYDDGTTWFPGEPIPFLKRTVWKRRYKGPGFVCIWRQKRQMYTLCVVSIGMHVYFAHVALLSSTKNPEGMFTFPQKKSGLPPLFLCASSTDFPLVSGWIWRMAICRSCGTHIGWRFESRCGVGLYLHGPRIGWRSVIKFR